MGKRKRIETVNTEIHLPEAIIQHIQSFLNGKQAAQTTLLSKLWYSAYSTRPNLDFDERYFQKPSHGDSKSASESRVSNEFVNFAKKTMLRYAELNLKIESFRLWVKSNDSYSISLADELIVKALEMGVSDLNLEFVIPHGPSYGWRYILPREVLENEALVKLSVVGCKINRLGDKKVCWSRLKSLSLTLSKIHMKDDEDILWDIISRSPLLENLLLSNCMCLVEVGGKVGQKYLNFGRDLDKGYIGSLVDDPNKFSEMFQKLKCLFLERVKLDSLFFDDFSLKFSCLEGLTLNRCEVYEKAIQISSRALKFLSLSDDESKRTHMEFNLPNIHKFTYSGSNFPFLSFKPTSMEWESDIAVLCSRRCFGVTFYRELKRFLKKLRSSKISLSLDLELKGNITTVKDVKCLPKTVVENLMLSMGMSYDSRVSWEECSSLLDGVIFSCRPKFITLNPFSLDMLEGPYINFRLRNRQKDNQKLLELLCKTLIIHQENHDCCIPNKSMIGLLDLEEVNVEFFEENLSEWLPFLPWKTLLDAPTTPEECRPQIRFRLGWGPT